MTKFETGKTYTGRFIGDSDLTITLTVAKRTEKTITTTDGKRFGVKFYDGTEYVNPEGVYAKCPSISACNPIA